MSEEENPPEKNDLDSLTDNSASEMLDGDNAQSGPIEAQFADPEIVDAVEVVAKPVFVPPPLAGNLENMSANGGAVGALVLGIWCVLGSFITNWSLLNGVLGLPLGVWGLASRKKRTAWIGIVLCLVGATMCIVQVSEWINVYMNAVDEIQVDVL